MTEEQKKKLEQKLWDIANTLRGKMNADEFRDYILGFIFYKYLSERMHLYANDVLKQDGIDYLSIDEQLYSGQAILAAVKEASVDALGYFLRPSTVQRGCQARVKTGAIHPRRPDQNPEQHPAFHHGHGVRG